LSDDGQLTETCRQDKNTIYCCNCLKPETVLLSFKLIRLALYYVYMKERKKEWKKERINK